MKELNKRANVRVKEFKGKDIVIYEDHRYLLNVLYHARSEAVLTGPVDLVRFDLHYDDLIPSTEALKKIAEYRSETPDLREFWNFTEFDLKSDDDDWLRAGYELGWIGNNILFNVCSGDYMPQVHKDKEGNEHHLTDMGYIWEAIERKGSLRQADEKNASAFDMIGWDGNEFKDEYKPYVLDIDLDAFSVEIFGERMACPEEVLLNHLRRKNQFPYNSLQFMEKLIERSLFVSICTESLYCGGIAEAHKILSFLDRNLFGNQLLKY